MVFISLHLDEFWVVLTGTTPVHDNEGSVSSILSQNTTQRLKNVLSSRSREAHDLSSQCVIFLSLRPGRQKPLREGERQRRRLFALAWARRRGHQFGFRAARGVCLSWRAERPPALLRTPSIFTFILLAIIIRMLWLHSLTRTARDCLEIFHETFST